MASDTALRESVLAAPQSARCFRVQLWTAKALPLIAGLLATLASPCLAQQKIIQPPAAPSPPAPPLPLVQRVAALEVAVKTLTEQLKDARDTAHFADSIAGTAKNDLFALKQQVDQLAGSTDLLRTNLGRLSDAYANHTHQLAVWGTGCSSVPGQPPGQQACLYVIGEGRPTGRVTSRPTQLPPG